jgi:hypothetical protein
MTTLLSLRSGLTLTLECAGGGGDAAVAPLFSDVWLGSAVWPAAHALIEHLEEHRAALRLPALSVLELGAGTGACGLAAAALGAARVLLTDKAALLPTLQHNIALNSAAGCVECRELTWSTAPLPPDQLPHGADLVLMSDCLNAVYGEQHALALAATLRCVLQRALRTGGVLVSPTGLVSQARRGSGRAEATFFAECERLGLEATLLRTWQLPAGVGGDGADAGGGSCVEVALHAVALRRCA